MGGAVCRYGVLHTVIDGGAAEAGRCDHRELGKEVADLVLGQGDGVEQGRGCGLSEGCSNGAHRGEGLRIDEVVSVDVNQQAGMTEEASAKEGA